MAFKLFDDKFREPTALVGLSLVAVFAAGCTAIFSKSSSEKYRARVVAAAVKEPWGSPRVTEYWRDVLSAVDFLTPPKDWCGGFALWALHRAGLGLDLKWTVGSGFLWKLPTTTDPKPGDIAYFTHNQHQAIVRSIVGNQVNLINGNGSNGKITPSQVDKSAVTAFYNIEPLIQKAVA